MIFPDKIMAERIWQHAGVVCTRDVSGLSGCFMLQQDGLTPRVGHHGEAVWNE